MHPKAEKVNLQNQHAEKRVSIDHTYSSRHFNMCLFKIDAHA
jgi:hypothetical protein